MSPLSVTPTGAESSNQVELMAKDSWKDYSPEVKKMLVSMAKLESLINTYETNEEKISWLMQKIMEKEESLRIYFDSEIQKCQNYKKD